MSIPIVGIGASAGGLEAFIQIFSKMPEDTGMAFVLIQHLDPTHPSMSAEIISRSTRLKVEEVKDGTRVKPNHVYIIPPNYNMEINSGVLSLSARNEAPGHNMAIDLFLQSLALSEKSKAIGVVLSGTGSDGTKGLLAIKAEGGITCVQEPASAKYQGMPKSAIVAGVADLILQPEEMALEFKRIAAHPYLAVQDRESPQYTEEVRGPDKDLRRIFSLLLAHTKVDFTHYKPTTIKRRIQRRMMLHKASSLQDYVKYIEAHTEEVSALYNDILINVTEFFRDSDSFEALASYVFPALLKNKTANQAIRVWVPGCSTGEEAYSIAMALTEYLISAGKKNPIQIFATDISERSIQKARQAVYPESISQNVSQERLGNFFERVEGGYKIQKFIRDTCLFSIHDVTSDPPFAKLHLISCRNLLIYFGAILQKQVFPIFHYALQPEGFLWLGKSENPGEFSVLFNTVEKTHKIYSKSLKPKNMSFRFPTKRKSDAYVERSGPELATETKTKLQPKAIVSPHDDVDKIIMAKFAPPSVVINIDMEILQFRGRTVPYLEPATGRPSLNLLKMARTELLAGLRAVIQTAKKENKPAKRQGLHLEVGGSQLTVDIEVLPIGRDVPAKERTFLVVFQPTGDKKSRDSSKATKTKNKNKKGKAKNQDNQNEEQMKELLLELAEVKDYQQSLIEQYETTQEELTSANEELQSTNEEFQSTNEEIETAKEELQSTNEELVTVNDELQMRNFDLSVLSSDLNNLLNNIEIPVLMVGGDRCIRRYSPKAKNLFNLIPTDIGRPVRDVQPNFELNLDEMVKEVIGNLNPIEAEIEDNKGNWLRIQVRPYKTIDNKIDGAVITLVDIDILKQKEALAIDKDKRLSMESRLARQANKEKDIFLATLSHELRTPLSAILTWSQLIANEKVNFEKAKEGARIIEQSAKAQSQLIDDLLDISRIVAGKLVLHLAVIDPAHAIRAAINAVQAMAEKKSIKIEFVENAEAALIRADAIRLQQIVWNLLTNAVKFSPANSAVQVKLDYVGGKVAQIQVCDQGKGISPQFMPHIFSRFTQADGASNRTYGGLGLGLSIVKSLVDLQGGQIIAENAPAGSRGAVFTVTFPLESKSKSTALKATPNHEAHSSVKGPANQPDLSGINILFVDDDESARTAITLFLNSFGANVRSVGSSREALSVLAEFKPHVILSDIAMPEEDGYSLLQKIRSLSPEHGGSIPAIALTAYATAEDVKRSLTAGFQVHMAKPADANELAKTILIMTQKN